MTLNSQLTLKILYILALTGSISNEETWNEDRTVCIVTENHRNFTGQESNKGVYLGDELSEHNFQNNSDTDWSYKQTNPLQNLTDWFENGTRNFSENLLIENSTVNFTDNYQNRSDTEMNEGKLAEQKNESYQDITDRPGWSGNCPLYAVDNKQELKLISLPSGNITDIKNEYFVTDQNLNTSISVDQLKRFFQLARLNSTKDIEYDQEGESSNRFTDLEFNQKHKFFHQQQKATRFTFIEPETIPYFEFLKTEMPTTEREILSGLGMYNMVHDLNTIGPMMERFFDQKGLMSDDEDYDTPNNPKRNSENDKISKEKLIHSVRKILDKTRERKRRNKWKRESPKPHITNKPLSPKQSGSEEDEQDNSYDDVDDKLPGDDQNEILNLWDDYILGLSGRNTSDEYEHRIIGGKLIPVEQVPYLVVLLRFEREMCAGTLITQEHVLTAAHCVTALGRKDNDFIVLRPDDFTIRYGSNTSEYGGHVERISYIFVHPEFLSNRKYHIYMDLSVLLLKNKLNLDGSKIATLPAMEYSDNDIEDLINSDMQCIVAGWGKTVKPKHIMRKRSLLVGTNLNLINYNYCMDLFRVHGLGISPRAHVCTYTEGKDACQGDSGGGLYCNTTIWGVTSWGIGCADKDIPGVFARVDTNLEFIRSSVNWDKSKILPTSSLILRSKSEMPKTPILLLTILESMIIITNNYR